MSDWAPKRFWSTASTERTDDGWTVLLDGRQVRTPARSLLQLPTQALAEAVAAEWRAQDEVVQPARMPMTRSANAAIDKVARQRDEVVSYIAEYGATDLLCYRAETPPALVAQQAEAWDPLLDWAREAYGAELHKTIGVLPVAQPDASLNNLRAEVHLCDDFGLTALHDLVMLSGSLVIGLAAVARVQPAERLWDVSRIDEAWQISQWGEDAEAEAMARAKRADFLHAADFHRLSQSAA